MIGCVFLLFTLFLWLFDLLLKWAFESKFAKQNASEFKGENSGKNEVKNKKLSAKNAPKFLALKYALTLFFTAFCLVPAYKGFCLATLMYSFFDAPSVLCVLLAGFFVCKVFLKDFANFELNLSIKADSFALLFVYGLVIFLGNLDLMPYDFYAPNAFAQAYLMDLLLYELSKCALVFALLLALYIVNKPCALLGLLALMPFAFIAEQNFLTALICVYLWAFSLAILLWQGVKFIKGKLCKNPLKE